MNSRQKTVVLVWVVVTAALGIFAASGEAPFSRHGLGDNLSRALILEVTATLMAVGLWAMAAGTKQPK